MSTVKDGWAVLLKLCPEFTNQCVCLDNYLGQVKGLDVIEMAWCPLYLCWYLWPVLMVTWILLMHVLQVVEHVIALKTSFLQKFTYIMHCCILNQKHGLLASTFKRTHWLVPGYLLGQAWKNRIWWRILRWRTCELGRFSVRMPVGLRQMAWVQVMDEDFRCDVILKTRP